MSKEELLIKIEEQLENDFYEDSLDPEISFFEKFYTQLSTHNIQNTLCFSKSEYVLSFLRLLNENHPFIEDLKKIEQIADCLEQFTKFKSASKYHELLKKTEIKNFLNASNDGLSIIEIFKILFLTNTEVQTNIIELRFIFEQIFDSNFQKLESCISILHSLDDDMICFLSSFTLLQDISDQLDNKENITQVFYMVNEEDLSFYDVIIKKIKKRYETLIAERKNKRKEWLKKQKKLQLLKQTLLQIKDQEYITLSSKVKKELQDEEIDKDFMNYVFHHNQILEKELTKKANKILEDENELLMAFQKSQYYYDVEKLPQLLQSKPIEDLKVILYSLKKLEYEMDDRFDFLLHKTTPKIMKELLQYRDLGIFDHQFFQKYSFICEPHIFDEFRRNVELLKQFYPVRAIKDPKVCLLGTSVLESYLPLAQEYQVPIQLDCLEKFIATENLEIIDLMIEMGFDHMEDYIDQINHDPLLPYKIKICKDGLLPLDSKEMLSYTISFDLSDEQILEYFNQGQIIDSSPMEEVEALLKNFEYDNLTYKINDYFISKNKVRRNLQRVKENQIENNISSILFSPTTYLPNEQMVIIETLQQKKKTM